MSIVPFNLQKNLIVNPSGNMMCIDARQPFTLKINTIYGNGNNTFALPLTNHTTNLKIETSDGQSITITNYADSAKLIQFPSAGIYTIKMRGECGWSFNNTGDCQKVIGISKWGRLRFNYLIGGFYGCINIGLNEGLPKIGAISVASNVKDITSIFRSCGLTIIENTGVFDLCINVTKFDYVFSSNSLTNVPAGLFDLNVKATSFFATFINNLIITIDDAVFANCINVTTFESVFQQNRLVTIPELIFRYNINVIIFRNAFYNNKLNNIPALLFKYNVIVTDFYGTFYLNELVSFPGVLFSFCPLVTSFERVFQQNLLSSIPDNAFDANTKVITFSSAFRVNRLSSIPVGLFDLCPLVVSFQETFTINLIYSIPNNLFVNNKLVTNYLRTFKQATLTGFVMPCILFDLPSLNIVTTFLELFYQTDISTSPTGTVQDIWNYASPTATKTDCFQNCTGLSNYASIPVDWI